MEGQAAARRLEGQFLTVNWLADNSETEYTGQNWAKTPQERWRIIKQATAVNKMDCSPALPIPTPLTRITYLCNPSGVSFVPKVTSKYCVAYILEKLITRSPSNIRECHRRRTLSSHPMTTL